MRPKTLNPKPSKREGFVVEHVQGSRTFVVGAVVVGFAKCPGPSV